MPAIAIIEHRLPGRIRVRIRSRRRDRPFFDAIAKRVREHPGFLDVTANPDSGSLLIEHTGDAEEILSLAADLLDVGDPYQTSERWSTVAGRLGMPAPAILDGTAVATAGLGVYQLARRGEFGTASENFWAAFGSYRILNSLGLTAVFAGVGVIQLLRGALFGSGTSLLFYSLIAHHLAESERSKRGAAGAP